MIRITLESHDGSYKEWTYDEELRQPCPFSDSELSGSSRVTVYLEDHFVILHKDLLFVSNLLGPCSSSSIDSDRLIICGMIICALHPDGETCWNRSEFEAVIKKHGIERFIP